MLRRTETDVMTSWPVKERPEDVRGDLFDLFVHRDELLLQILPLAPQQADEVAHACCQVRIRVIKRLRHGLLQREGRLGKHHATLEQEGPQLVDNRRPASDEPSALSVMISVPL